MLPLWLRVDPLWVAGAGQGRVPLGHFPVGHSLDAKPIPALPRVPFSASDPGRVRLVTHTEDPPPPCPFQSSSKPLVLF